MATQTYRPRVVLLGFLLTILLIPPQAQAQKEKASDEISDLRLSFDRMHRETVLDSSLA